MIAKWTRRDDFINVFRIEIVFSSVRKQRIWNNNRECAKKCEMKRLKDEKSLNDDDWKLRCHENQQQMSKMWTKKKWKNLSVKNNAKRNEKQQSILIRFSVNWLVYRQHRWRRRFEDTIKMMICSIWRWWCRKKSMKQQNKQCDFLKRRRAASKNQSLSSLNQKTECDL